MRIITKYYRGNIIENFHIGYAVVLGENGEAIFNAGDPNYPTFIRSTAKPFQTAAMVEAGVVDKFGFTNEELAVMCSSHNGEVTHTDLVYGMLKKVSIGVDELQCGACPPLDRSSYEQLILQGKRPTAIHNPCSGKHVGMIAMAKAMDVSHENYHYENHPVQQRIFEKIKYYSEREKIPIAVDGCGVPTYFLPLRNLTLMYRKLISEEDEFLRVVATAMTLNPYHIAGRNRFDTDFITAMGGKGISKLGSDGVRALGLRGEDGKYYGIAIKVPSGKNEVSAYMAVMILKHLKLVGEGVLSKLDKYDNPKLKNYTGMECGRVETELVAAGEE